MKDYHINIFYSEEDGGYIADTPDLPHCAALGKSPEEALKERCLRHLPAACESYTERHKL